MGSPVPGSWGAESRGWLLVPHYRSLRICPNLSLVNTRRVTMPVLADLPVDGRRDIPSASGVKEARMGQRPGASPEVDRLAGEPKGRERLLEDGVIVCLAGCT